MNFQDLGKSVIRLRNLLTTCFGLDTIEKITVPEPSGKSSELDFVRLVAWGYVLIFEAGRVTIGYLLELPYMNRDGKSDQRQVLESVHTLRTWNFHNLNDSTVRDQLMQSRVKQWFLESCNASEPSTEREWRACFEVLCVSLSGLVSDCQNIIESVQREPDNGVAIKTGLFRRIQTDWPAYRFDAIVEESASRLGIDVNIRSFREFRIAKWRRFIEDIGSYRESEEQVVRIIERDLLDHVDGLLPITGEDIMLELDIEAGPKVGELLRHARALHHGGIREKEELLKRLRGTKIGNIM